MLGFLIGTVCLIGLVKVARHGGGCGYGGYGGAYGHHGGYGSYGSHSRRGGFGPRVFLRHAFERLDTTPGQEKVILAAVDELKDVLGKAKGDFRGTRDDFAKVFRGESLDEASVADIFMKHDTTLSEARRGAVEAFRKIHEALTEKQRAQVADFLERGPDFRGGWGSGRWGRPHRGQWT
jgi:hypothetical protein